ncbi:metal-sulfur cluster assembly factor [Microbispora sp. NPDC049125]|uniref:metal-sulfur cluster assembly factor n=1 Tax=Microbispora sp. NPDC049125 TaxID=3154929 RepID=UPI00346503CF
MTEHAAPEDAAVRAALDQVFDPCSQAWQRPLSLRELGLVRDVRADQAGRVTVVLSLTSPFCMALPTIMQAVELRVGEVPGVTGVSVEIDSDTSWSPGLMTPAGRKTLQMVRVADADRG